MSQRIRNMVLALGAAAFLATAFGITLHLHLAHLHSPTEHDAAHCPTCQQFLISKKEYTVEIESAEIEIDTVGHRVQTYPTAPPLQQISRRPCHPRAPPA